MVCVYLIGQHLRSRSLVKNRPTLSSGSVTASQGHARKRLTSVHGGWASLRDLSRLDEQRVVFEYAGGKLGGAERSAQKATLSVLLRLDILLPSHILQALGTEAHHLTYVSDALNEALRVCVVMPRAGTGLEQKCGSTLPDCR
jgi:hypothetical protein